MFRKKWLSLYFSTYWCYIHQLFILTWIYRCHMVVYVIDLHFTLQWPLLGRNDQVYISVPRSATFSKLTPTVHLDMAYWCHVVLCVFDLLFTLKVIKTQNSTSGAPVMVPITIMPSFFDLFFKDKPRPWWPSIGSSTRGDGAFTSCIPCDNVWHCTFYLMTVT